MYKALFVAWFYIGWFACVYLAKMDLAQWSLAIPFVSYLVFFQLKIFSRAQWGFLLLMSVSGICFDFLFYKIGLVQFLGYEGLFIPYWLVSMWFLFAGIFPLTYEFLSSRFWLSVVLAAIGGPMSYYSGVAFQIMSFSSPQVILIYAVFWSIFIPCLIHFYRKLV